jgi:hypothetical protein
MQKQINLAIKDWNQASLAAVVAIARLYSAKENLNSILVREERELYGDPTEEGEVVSLEEVKAFVAAEFQWSTTTKSNYPLYAPFEPRD